MARRTIIPGLLFLVLLAAPAAALDHRDRDFDQTHLILRVTPDIHAGRVDGEVTIEFTSLLPNLAVLRLHSRESTTAILERGEPSPFLDLVANDPEVPLDRADLDALMDPARFIGRAPEQVAEYLDGVVRPLLAAAGELPEARDLDV